jgi:hypothetical protein
VTFQRRATAAVLTTRFAVRGLIVAVLLAAVIADLFAVVVARRTHTAAVLREG